MFTKEFLWTFGDSTAVVTQAGEHYSYQELSGLSEDWYENIGHRCLVFCLCQNTIGSLVGYVSCLSNKVVPLLLDASLDIALLNNLIEVYRPEYLWLPKRRLDDFEDPELVYEWGNYVLVKLCNGNVYTLYDDLGLLLTTSGSTGSPKLVRLSYENIYSNAEAIAEYLSITGAERPVTSLPMNYSFGISVINSHLLQGATILLTDKSLMEKDFWSFIKEEKASSLSGVPYTYEMLKRLRFFRMDLPSLRTFTQAGGKMGVELTREFAEYAQVNDKRLFVMYGQTEATARMSYLPAELALSKAGSIGLPVPGGVFRLIDVDNREITGSDVEGELVYEGANVSLGYADSGEDLGKGDENNGILYTGDLAKRDSDGYYYITGRKKRFIKLFGNRINLDETEGLLKKMLQDCACIGVDDRMAIYITEQGREEEIRQYISAKTGIHFKSFDVRWIDSIPKTSSGKTIYAGLIL